MSIQIIEINEKYILIEKIQHLSFLMFPNYTIHINIILIDGK